MLIRGYLVHLSVRTNLQTFSKVKNNTQIYQHGKCEVQFLLPSTPTYLNQGVVNIAI